MTAADVRADVISYFDFYPSLALCIVGLVLFTIAAFAVFAMTLKTKQWYMVIASTVGLMEAGGYSARIAMLRRPVFGAFVVMQCLLIISPSFLALVQYITLAKVINLVKMRYPDRKLLVRPKLVIWGFFAMEITALACQGAGAGLSVSTQGVSNLGSGRVLLIVGLVALVVLIICYLVTAIYVNLSPAYAIKSSPNMRKLFPVLYVCTSLLLIRNIFRLIEFGQGFNGAISDQEKYFYGFDALMIILILVINTVFHFGLYLKAYPSELKEEEHPSSVELV